MAGHDSEDATAVTRVSETGKQPNGLRGHQTEVPLGLIHLAPDGTFRATDDTFRTLTGYSQTDLTGESVITVLSSEIPSIDALLHAFQTERSGPLTADLPIETATGEIIRCTTTLQCLDGTSDGSAGDVIGLLRPTPLEPARQPRFASEDETAVGKSFSALANAISDGIIVLDSNSDIRYANPAIERILGYTPAELVGGSKLKIIPERLQSTHLAALQRYLDTGERNIDWSYVELPGQHENGHEVPLGISLNTFTYEGARYFVGLVRDITPRKQAEQALTRRLAQQETAARLGRHALRTTTIDDLLDEAVEAVAAGLSAKYAKVLELTEDDRELLLRSGIGWKPGLVGNATISATADDSQAGHTLSAARPVIVEDLRSESRFSGPPLLTDHDVRSGISVTIGSAADPWGILGVHDTRCREFTDHDVHFVETIAHILATAIARSRYTEQLELQRKQLSALDRLNTLIHGIHQAIIKETSQADIERLVCNGLVERDTYRFAAVWHTDPATDHITPAAHAGYEAGYLCSVTGGASAENRPVDRAFEDREVYVVSDIATAEPSAPWCDEALSRGYRSVAAVPIVYDNTLFGVLSVFADKKDAFGGTVQAVLGVLGETIGHAIATTNQEQTLLSQEKTVVTLSLQGFADAAGVATFGEGSFDISSLVPIGDGRYLLYGEGDSGIEETLARMENTQLDVTVLTIKTVGKKRARFELEVTDPPVISRVLAHGGRLLDMAYRGSDLITTIELPPTVKVSQLTAALEEIHPDLTVALYKRQASFESPASSSGVFDDLTDRQRAALETAFYNGYFEWPRENDGNAIASKLGVSSATFQQHFRTGQRKLLSNLLEGT